MDLWPINGYGLYSYGLYRYGPNRHAYVVMANIGMAHGVVAYITMAPYWLEAASTELSEREDKCTEHTAPLHICPQNCVLACVRACTHTCVQTGAQTCVSRGDLGVSRRLGLWHIELWPRELWPIQLLHI